MEWVQEYGGAAAIVSYGVAYFSHLDDGRVYRVEVGGNSSEPVAITPENYSPSPLRYRLLRKAHLLPDGEKLAWLQWNHPDMPWHGAELYIADVSINDDNILTNSNHVHVAGVHSKVSAQYPAWKDNDTLVYISGECGFMNPWNFSLHIGKSCALFPDPVHDFGHPLWVLAFFPYTIIGDQGVFTAMKDGRSRLYIVNSNQPSSPTLLLPNPYVSIAYVRSSSSKDGKKHVTFVGRKSTGSPSSFE
ncbi:hypothetical protein D9613_012694 [Agrocybe pediades]|uniref:Uncharacterized protein n=1 Tax=Agrocybe pediades TaxID=84607 RepID=A0A8H4QKE5_9AGAR|nr:hypothetical protein D9613_012694 [Agrocybe pediades]